MQPIVSQDGSLHYAELSSHAEHVTSGKQDIDFKAGVTCCDVTVLNSNMKTGVYMSALVGCMMCGPQA